MHYHGHSISVNLLPHHKTSTHHPDNLHHHQPHRPLHHNTHQHINLLSYTMHICTLFYHYCTHIFLHWCESVVVLVPSSLGGFLGFHPYMCLFSLRKLFCWLFYSTEGNLLFNIKMKRLHFVLLYGLFWWLAFFGDLGRLFYHDYSIADCYRF